MHDGTPPVTIRPARRSDVAELTSLLRVLFTIEEDFGVDGPLQKKGLGMMLDTEQACILAAEVSGRVIGMCTGQLTVSTAEGGPALLVEDVIVRSEYRGQGIGRMLMEEIFRWGGRKGALRLQLLADRNNIPALKFYEKLGWKQTQLICLRKKMF